MHLLYPSDPFDKFSVDDDYADELAALTAAGFTHSLFSFEDFEAGSFRARPALHGGEQVLYRGWMMTPERYALLAAGVENQGARLVTCAAEYRRCHHLPEWYALCKDFTPETVITDRNADFAQVLAGLDWPGYFVKDYVKSLTTQRGSVARTPDQVAELVSLIERYRGSIEGGICIRKFEALATETEQRYFAFNGTAYSRDGEVPSMVHEISRRIASPFFSIDTVHATSGQLRLIELGDGQVSDRKQWSPEQFAAMLVRQR